MVHEFSPKAPKRSEPNGPADEGIPENIGALSIPAREHISRRRSGREETSPTSRRAQTTEPSSADGDLALYFKSITGIPLLTPQQEIDIALRYKDARQAHHMAVLGCDHSARKLLSVIEGVLDGNLRIDRALDLPQPGKLSGDRARTLLSANFKTCHALLERNKVLFEKLCATSLIPTKRAETWKTISRNKLAIATLLVECRPALRIMNRIHDDFRLLSAGEGTSTDKLGCHPMGSYNPALGRQCVETEATFMKRVSLVEATRLQRASVRNEMVHGNYRLVISVAKRFQNRGLLLPELIQEGNLGLMHAVEKFDPSREIRFSTYATLWIEQRIQQALRCDTRTVRLPTYIQGDLVKLKKGQEMLSHQLKRPPTNDELAERMKVRLETVEGLSPLIHNSFGSLDAPITIASCEDTRSENAEGELDRKLDAPALRSAVEEVLAVLSPRERDILILYKVEGLKLQDIGERYGICRERARQLKDNALAKLANHSKLPSLREFLDNDS